MTTVIITECKNPYGLFWTFKVKGSGRKLAEVDRTRKSNCGYAGYKVFAGEWPSEVARCTKKAAAMEFAKACCRHRITDEVEFKWNVMREIEKWR